MTTFSPLQHASPSAVAKHRRSRGHLNIVIGGGVLALATATIAGFALRGRASSSSERVSADTTLVRRGAFDVTLPVSGELAALKQIEIRNKVDGRSTITEIVAEGTLVNPGDVVLRLNDDEIRTELREDQEQLIDAEAAMNTAEAELAIQQITRKAELAKADVAIMLADLALKAWIEGEDPAKRQELAMALEMAEKDHTRLEARFVESAKLLDKKFISLDEYKQDEIALIEARAKLTQAKLDLTVYEQYQAAHDKAEKQSELDQAQSERERVEKQFDAEVRSAEIEVNSKRLQLSGAREDVAREEEQLSFCVIQAPSAGLVVYFSSLQQGGMGRNDGRPPVVGTELTKNEAVMVLPDTSQMVAAVKVSEALSGTIHAGQRASIISDANPDRALFGEVLSVGVLAESGGWRDPNRRDYTVKILLKDGYDLGLKPSMRCKAEIYVGRVSDALYVPIQAVFRNGPLIYVYVPQDGGYAQKQVTIGRASELYIEVKADEANGIAGLSEGQVVLLREPDPEEVVYRLPVPKNEEKEMLAAGKEGEAGATEAAAVGPPNGPFAGRPVGAGEAPMGAPAGAPGAGNGGRPGGSGAPNGEGRQSREGAGERGSGNGNGQRNGEGAATGEGDSPRPEGGNGPRRGPRSGGGPPSGERGPRGENGGGGDQPSQKPQSPGN